jgi:hypothetical protein
MSVGKSERFFEESHIKKLKALPIMYQEKLDKETKSYHKISFGYGKKTEGFEKRASPSPGPVYNHHVVNSMSYQSPY